MGYDVSFHPVDVSFFHDRILPYVLGKQGIDDLVERAVRISKARFRSNAWGLGLLSLKGEQKKLLPKTFDSHLYVWGRPFFITLDSPQEVSQAIDRYLAAEDDAAVDEIAREMIRHLNPALLNVAAPSEEGSLPTDENLARGIRGNLQPYREAYELLPSGRPLMDADGDDHDPKEVLETGLSFTSLQFASNFRPGWMARGYVWPTCLLEEADFDPEDYFTTALELLSPLLDEVPDIDFYLEETITENYVVGGYVAPDRVARFREFVEENRDALEGKHELAVEVRKILEALYDAEHRGYGFLEATEIYSGGMGIMN